MRKVMAVVLGVLVVLSLLGVASARTTSVKVRGEKWRPVHKYIGTGDRVRFKNNSTKVHDIKAYGGGWRLSKVLQPGKSVTRKFGKRGTFKYRCVRHSGMVAGRCQGMCGFVHVVR